MADQAAEFMVENARLIFRNFTGVVGPFNKNGERSFCVILEPDMAEVLARDGWNVKTLKPREDEEEAVGTPYIPVKVNFKNMPPTVVVITETSRTHMTEEMIGTLDMAEIRTVDLVCRAYEWDVNGKQGVAAYLKAMYVTIEEDYLAKKYAL